MAIAMAMALAAAAAAAAVIRPEHAEGARNHENRLFIEKHYFGTILPILGAFSTSKMGPARNSAPENGIGRPGGPE